jgi:DNA-directed RNA polymerase sigma subunit (sigma70/sigma32)
MKDEPRNLVQIAAIMGMSPERVRQIKISGTCLLRDALKEQGVEASHDAY